MNKEHQVISMTPELELKMKDPVWCKQFLIDAGILNDDGTLNKNYGGADESN